MPTDIHIPRDSERHTEQSSPTADAADDQEGQTQCAEALFEAGISPILCQFFAESQQCERSMFHAIYRMHRELRDICSKPTNDVSCLLNTVERILKSFDSWRQTIEQLASRCHSLPPMKLDPRKFDEKVAAQAKCWLQTKSIKMSPGDEIVITDITRPNELKVRTGQGSEGYVPTLNCILPSPDCDASSTVKRLQVHLLMCWAYCDANVETAAHHVISNLTSLLRQHSEAYVKNHHGSHNGHSGAIKAFVDDVDAGQDGGKRWKALRHSVAILLQKLRTVRDPGIDLVPILENLTDIEKVIFLYEDFHEHACRSKRHMQEISSQPISIEFCRDLQSLIRARTQRRHKYYEVKMTMEETVTKEETTYLKIAGENGRNGVHGGQTSQSVDAEQLTSMSHEESTRFVIKGVIDPRTSSEIPMDEAVKDGIIDSQRGLYIDPTTQQSWPIAQAMNDGRILVERVSTTKSAAKTESLGIITVRTKTDTSEFSVTAAVDTAAGETVSTDEARRRGIVDEATGLFVNTKTGDRVPLSDAVDAGLVTAEYEVGQETNGNGGSDTKTYAINAVVDQMARKPVPFPEAVRRGLIDRESGCYINNATGERVFAPEAIRRGLFKAVLVTDPSSLSNIDESNRVVVERIQRVRKNVMRNMKTIAAFRQNAAKKQ